MHVKQALRANMAALLETIPAVTGKVYQSRVHPLSKDDMPCIIVKSGPESIDLPVKGRQSPALQKRLIVTEVYCFVRAKDKVEDALDEIAAIVENKVFTDYTLGGIAAETSLVGTDSYIGGEPSSPVGALLMNFLSTVYTKEGLPENAIRNS